VGLRSFKKIEAAAPSARRLPNADAAQPLPRYFAVVKPQLLHLTFQLPPRQLRTEPSDQLTWKKGHIVPIILISRGGLQLRSCHAIKV
jgi:hypothetical protein